MYYHLAILLVFRPFWNLQLLESITFPRTVCSEAAQSLFLLIRTFKDLYTLRRTPSFVPFGVLTGSLIYLGDLKQEETLTGMTTTRYGSEALDFLAELCASHFFAKRSAKIIRFFSEHWGVQGAAFDTASAENQQRDDEDEEQHLLAFPPMFTFFRPRFGSEGYFPDIEPSPGVGMLFYPFHAQGRTLVHNVSNTRQASDGEHMRQLRQMGFESVSDGCYL